MKYSFRAFLFKDGNRSFIRIPFNVWEETGLKGNIPCRIELDGIKSECRLIPKGEGWYLIPVAKKIADQTDPSSEHQITLEIIQSLTRINHDSPYSVDNPVRKIDSITPIPILDGLCGQCAVAMLAGLPLSDVTALMGKGKASWSKILETLDYYGIAYDTKAVYLRGKQTELPPCCVVNNDDRFLLWYDGSFQGVSDADPEKTVSYFRILI
ncbi:MAG: DUF1905 domain-containing protein [Bullifex sp.]